MGVIAILIPKFPLLKEWAYAGFFFAVSGAVCAHLARRHRFFWTSIITHSDCGVMAISEGMPMAQTDGKKTGPAECRGSQALMKWNHMNPKVDWFFSKDGKWQKAFQALRKIILDCDLVEELKWGRPCYTRPTGPSGRAFEKRNIVLMHGFKEYCALLFFKGALLKDPKGILIQQTENVQAARQIRFTDAREIVRMKATLKAYIYEAIAVEEAGLKVTYKKTTAFKIPDEFQNKLDEKPALKKAFYALTPGRQRAYIFYFASARQSKTREARVEKYTKRILDGKGLDD